MSAMSSYVLVYFNTFQMLGKAKNIRRLNINNVSLPYVMIYIFNVIVFLWAREGFYKIIDIKDY